MLRRGSRSSGSLGFTFLAWAEYEKRTKSDGHCALARSVEA
jgi:hypothetical protein